MTRRIFSTLKAFPLAGGTEPKVLLERIDYASNVGLMPVNNKWLAYQSSESGRPEIYLARFPIPGTKFPVSFAGGIQPLWSKDGKRLYYPDPGLKLFEAA